MEAPAMPSRKSEIVAKLRIVACEKLCLSCYFPALTSYLDEKLGHLERSKQILPGRNDGLTPEVLAGGSSNLQLRCRLQLPHAGSLVPDNCLFLFRLMPATCFRGAHLRFLQVVVAVCSCAAHCHYHMQAL